MAEQERKFSDSELQDLVASTDSGARNPKTALWPC